MNRNKIIEEAQELLRKGWTKGVEARDSSGNPVPYSNPAACSFCALGALARSLNQEGTIPISTSWALFEGNQKPQIDLMFYNDAASSAEEVIAYLERLKEEK